MSNGSGFKDKVRETSEVRRCRLCLLTEFYPKISFDQDGICNYCSAWEKKWSQIDFAETKKSLEGILNKYKGKSKPYDCLIGLSGGKDSCYSVYLTKKLGMHPLTVTFDNGFLTESAKLNIEKIVRKLGLGHIIVKFNDDLQFQLYKNSILKTGEFCSVCNTGIRASLYRIAKSYHINLVIKGTSTRTEANSPIEYFTCSPGYFRKVAKNSVSNKDAKSYCFLSQSKRILWHLLKRPYFMNLPSFVPWIESEFIDELRTELDIDFNEFKQHSDCSMNDAKEYLKFEKFGVLEKCAKLSSLIRDGQLKREKGLELLVKEEDRIIHSREEIRKNICRSFHITCEQLDGSLECNHMDYVPGHEVLIRKTYKILNKIKVLKSRIF